jgi:peptide/nickel transport system permease protein
VTYFVRRLAQSIVVGVAVVVAVFFVTTVIGDPTSVMLPIDAPDAQREALRELLGYNRPLADQFTDFVDGVVQLDFGDSLWQQRPAMDVALERLPMTFRLVAPSILLAIVLGLLLGLIAALRPGGLIDRVMETTSLILASVPEFWLGLMLIIVFAVSLGALPTSGFGSWRHFVLPVVTLALPIGGRLALVLRASLIEEMHVDYINMDRARGFSMPRIMAHALRNSVTPFLTFGGFQVAAAFAGHTVLVETVFAWPGLGLLIKQALDERDIPLIQAVVALVAVLVVAINLIFDVIVGTVDPRISAARRKK